MTKPHSILKVPLTLTIVAFLSVFAMGPAYSLSTTRLQAGVYTSEEETMKLEPQVLDYRYSPYRWQVCIGLPDDPHKSIVGSDGGIYYDFGSKKGMFYKFGTRVLASLETEIAPGDIRQSLHDPRTPIVITERDYGGLTLQQQAWAGAPREAKIEGWAPNRVDYLWIKMKNNGSSTQKGRIVVQVNPGESLIANDDYSRLLSMQDSKRTFVSMQPVCESVVKPNETGVTFAKAPRVEHRWARPQVGSDARFRSVIIGLSEPLVMKYKGQPGKKYKVAYGLIEGWHKQPGVRSLDIRVNGKKVRTVDLVEEYGHNKSAVLMFDAVGRKRDGVVELGVYSPGKAKDKNTVLSALWIFDADNAPDEETIRKGKADKKALSIIDANTVQSSQMVNLLFPEKRLLPGAEYSVLLSFPQGEKAELAAPVRKSANREHQRAIKYWANVDLPYDRISVPDPELQGLLDSSIRNIYQARELRNGAPAFQVGPTYYRGTWAADGPFILESITYLGRANEVRAGLELQVDEDEGPSGVAFSKKSGLRLWMIWRHAQLTGDSEWMENIWPKVTRNVELIKKYRQMTRRNPEQANYGLTPIGYGDGGLGGKHREYTNVYWTLAGLKAAIDMAVKMNKPELENWRAEYADYWQCFDKARNRDKLVDDYGNTYVPVTMKGEEQQLPQCGAWAFMQSLYPGRIFDPKDELMLGTVAMLDSTQEEGLIFGTGWIKNGVWNYGASFYGHVHIWLKHGKKAAATLYAFGNHACPLLTWREEQNLVGKSESYCGDMPHNWASAEFIRMVRHLLIMERDDELHLLEALPSSWTKPGDEIRMVDIPTSFGDVSMTVKMAKKGNSATIRVDVPKREMPRQVVVHLEHFNRPVTEIKMGSKTLKGKTVKISTSKSFTLRVKFGD
jgi:hypothetical protein